MPTPGGAAAVFAERQQRQNRNLSLELDPVAEASPVRFTAATAAEPSLLEEEWDGMDEASFEIVEKLLAGKGGSESPKSPLREVFTEKENVPL